MAKFEVAIFNQDVRDRMAEGRRHRDLADTWADIHYIEIEAEDVDAARKAIARRYPEERGYVVESIERMKYSD